MLNAGNQQSRNYDPEVFDVDELTETNKKAGNIQELIKICWGKI